MSGTAAEAQGRRTDSVGRFAFGANWQRFLRVLDERRIEGSQRSLTEMLGVASLAGRSFLDVGSGSGLFSLAAMKLGAERVHSFDYDQESVACTRELKRRYFPDSPRWTIEQGSVLDEGYLGALGQWDVVYSWGVLHHTGDMWRAMGSVAGLVKPQGLLFIAIYNDQGLRSRAWRRIKALYNRGPVARWVVTAVCVPFFVTGALANDVLHGCNPRRRYRDYGRGMSPVRDWADWLGGYPFEVARPGDVFDFYHRRGFVLERLRTVCGRSGCNEFVFRRTCIASSS